MSVFIGIDVGTVSVKVALVGDRGRLCAAAAANGIFRGQPRGLGPSSDLSLLVTEYRRIKGSPLTGTYDLLEQIVQAIPPGEIAGVRVCGSGSELVREALGVGHENEFRALARGVGALHPEVHSVFEIGGQNSKYIDLERDAETGAVGIADYEKSGDCAAGTGSFLDQQATRLRFDVEEIGRIASDTERSAKIAGRCSVFAKSDMIHAQQKGYTPAEVLKGLCEAIARNFKSSIIKGKRPRRPAAFIGGVARNSGVVTAMRELFKMAPDEMVVPEHCAALAAIGTALAERAASTHAGMPDIEALRAYQERGRGNGAQVSRPLSSAGVVILGDQVRPGVLPENGEAVQAYLGIDIGSISTNFALIDDEGRVLKAIYTRTDGRPIEVADRCLREVETEFGDRLQIKGVGTTGSGRELIGELVGADTVNDEITAHKTGAEFVARTMLEIQPDTIFDIGGQDSKYISIENGVVVDFTMNEACAAGTGSFLEERAEELGISIKGEFADLALSSKAPAKLGERCTVFMQQDVLAHQHRGATKADLTAGLAYSIAYNYLNRVVRGRKIGDVVFFQGGTAYNKAIASAFAEVLGKEIVVPPYNGVMGAVGSALLAREKVTATAAASTFRGYSLEQVEYSLREFTCKACSNFCNMQEFTVEGEKTFWGDQCSDKFRRKQASDRQPVIDDLLAFRHDLLFRDYDPDAAGDITIGLPRGMYVHEQFPFWNTLFRQLGFRTLLSDETNTAIVRTGVEASVAEPCLPIQAYHGHVQNVLDKGIDWLFIPNLINAATPFEDLNSHYCLWGQTLPFVIGGSAAFEHARPQILSPLLRFREGRRSVERSLSESLKPLGVSGRRVGKALAAAYDALEQFQRTLLDAGERALRSLEAAGEIGIVLVGRVYNIHDRGMILDIGSKLRDYYGVNVIPMDFLPVDDVDISDVNHNMFWNYGRKILAAAKIVGGHDQLHIIYMTNFKCGPDSYVKHYVTKASRKPYLVLQFDGHGNDAGYLTRCEAYLDSKGALRRWAQQADVASVELTTAS